MFRTISLPPAAFAVRGFTIRDRSLVSLVVKASGQFDPASGVVTLAPGSQLVTEEVHRPGGALTSLAHGSDVALVVPRPEVLVVGSAVSRRAAVTTHDVTLTVSRAGQPVLQKALRVESTTPFERYPLVYERSLGGMTSRVNPVGRGMDPGSPPPELLYASSTAPKNLPVGLGPLPGIWPIRQQYRGGFSYYEATSKPWLDLPDTFDERYYQQAPLDQQLDSLAPDDVVSVSGVHAQLPTVLVVVPRLHGVAFIDLAPRASAPTRLDLRLDTLFVNVETFEIELLWRGIFPLARATAEQIAFAGGVETPGARLDPPHLRGAGVQISDAPTRTSLTNRGTEIIEPVRPPSNVPAPVAIAAPAHHSGTMVIEPDEPPRQPTKLIFEDVVPVSLPFAKRSREGGAPKHTPPPPGSPWAGPDHGSAPAPVRVEPNLASTLLVPPSEPPPAPAPAPAVEPPVAAPPLPPYDPPPEPKGPPAEPPPTSRSNAKKKKSVWREDPPEAPVVAPPPAAPAPKADVSKLIYKKLKR